MNLFFGFVTNSTVMMAKSRKISPRLKVVFTFPLKTYGIIPGSWQPCWQDTVEQLVGSHLLPCQTPSYQTVPLPFGTKPSH